MSNRRLLLILSLLAIIVIGVFPALSVNAETTLIAPIPGSSDAGTSLGAYLSAAFKYGLGLAALIALAQLIFGAVQYTTSAGAPSLQEDAKSRMTSALIGVVLLASGALIWLLISSPTTVEIPRIPAPEPSAADLAAEAITNEQDTRSEGATPLDRTDLKTLSELKNSFLYTNKVNHYVNRIVDEVRNPLLNNAQQKDVLLAWEEKIRSNLPPFDKKIKLADGTETWEMDPTAVFEVALLRLKGLVPRSRLKVMRPELKGNNHVIGPDQPWYAWLSL